MPLVRAIFDAPGEAAALAELRRRARGTVTVAELGPSLTRDDRVSVEATFRADGAADAVTILMAAFGGRADEYDVREDHGLDGHDPYYWSEV